MENVNEPLKDLREDFARIAERLTPDVEPAVVYSPEAPDSEAE